MEPLDPELHTWRHRRVEVRTLSIDPAARSNGLKNKRGERRRKSSDGTETGTTKRAICRQKWEWRNGKKKGKGKGEKGHTRIATL